MRQIIISLIGLGIIALGYFGMQKMSATEKPKPKKELRGTPSVFLQKVKNTNTPISISTSGNLAAKERIEIFSEVQGIFNYSDKLFKPGMYYEEGSVLLTLNSDEPRANLRAQKSNLYNQIVSILPDLRFDYPEAFERWKKYVNEFNMEKSLKPLPKAMSESEKLFIAGRNISSTWYTVKNIEERLRKYTIYAPFSGILTEANVDKGALVRAGQKLGAFINPNVYELEVGVNSNYGDLLRVGNSVKLSNVEKTKSWKGRISRINSLINPNTQTIQAYIHVSGKHLREGMYMEAELTARNEPNTFEVSRKLIVDNEKLFIHKDGFLKLKEIIPVHFTDKTAIVRGLEDGTQILEKSLPGAYDGMEVKPFEASQN